MSGVLLLLLSGLLPLSGSLLGFKIQSFSRPPSYFKVQFHEAGPRLELGLNLNFAHRQDKSTQENDTTTSFQRITSRVVGGNLTLLQPVLRKPLKQGFLQGLVGLGPWVNFSFSKDSLSGSPEIWESQVRETQTLELGAGLYLGLEYAFTYRDLGFRIQALARFLGFSWQHGKEKLKTWAFPPPYQINTTHTSWNLEGLSLTQGALGVWLFLLVP